MTHLAKSLQGWLEEATLKWLVVLAGCGGVGFLLLLNSSVISHLGSPDIARSGWSDPEQRPSPVLYFKFPKK